MISRASATDTYRTPSSAAVLRANSRALASPSDDGSASASRSAPASNSNPASTQPDVPLRRSYTRGNPMRCSVRAPMMLRVRPAQLTTMVASSCPRRMSWMRRGSSALGTLRPPGMQSRRYSSGVRVSRITSLSPCLWRSSSSSAVISGTRCSTETRSPNSLLKTFIPHSVA